MKKDRRAIPFFYSSTSTYSCTGEYVSCVITASQEKTILRATHPAVSASVFWGKDLLRGGDCNHDVISGKSGDGAGPPKFLTQPLQFAANIKLK